MLGGFLGRRRDEASEAAAASLKSRLRDIAQLGPDVSLSANEIVCSDPACPGTETIVLVMVPGPVSYTHLGAMPLAQGRIVRGERAKRIAYLPQAADIDRSFPMSVYDLVAMGLWSRSGLFRSIGGADRRAVAEALDAVGLQGFERRPIGTLSGGQMQRALFARLLLQDADLILLDEPFTAIDAKTAADLLDLVHRWHTEQRTVVAVLHDLDLVRRAFPEAIVIAREPIAWGQTAAALAPENMLKARRMIEAFDPHARACQREDDSSQAA